MAKKADLTHESILVAAQEVLRTQGVRAFTLDKVAKQAGVSKGGLIHHFPSKEALLGAMHDHAFQLIDLQMQRILSEEPEAPGRYLRAYLKCNLESISNGIPSVFQIVAEMSLAEPELFRTKRECIRGMMAMVEGDGVDPVMGHIIAAASDSIWLQVLFGLTEPDDPHIHRVHDRLMAMTRE
ncbi:MAG: TetR/AcrR family transcriptional regulator [Acidobacteria bacterium]|nr:TetR/AcrR family transcriptional regulator [Acidobacteriota bacterium]